MAVRLPVITEYDNKGISAAIGDLKKLGKQQLLGVVSVLGARGPLGKAAARSQKRHSHWRRQEWRRIPWQHCGAQSFESGFQPVPGQLTPVKTELMVDGGKQPFGVL